MTEKEKIKQVLYRFIDAGLISKDLEQLLSCLSEPLLGIGLGEQGFVTCLDDVRAVILSGTKEEDTGTHSVEYGRIESLAPAENFAVVCAEIIVVLEAGGTSGKRCESRFSQSLTLIKEGEDWKICGLHASTPVMTEEELEAYPLKIAEKTLLSLREKIGEEAYQAEEQYRQAILSDAVAFYIINFTKNMFEKCQLNGDLCVSVDPGDPYEELVHQLAPTYVVEEDKAAFVDSLSREAVQRAFSEKRRELACEYRMKRPGGQSIWLVTIIRLITDMVTGDQKGIMYVKNIDQTKREDQAMRERATYDQMTAVYNKDAFFQNARRFLENERQVEGGLFVMLDVDRFKTINDTFGHPDGDRVLIEVARTLKETFRGAALVGRLGGDEFGILIPGKALDGLVQKELQEVLEAIRAIRIEGAPSLRLTCSIGVARAAEGDRFDDLYKRADKALYQSKENGRDRVSYMF